MSSATAASLVAGSFRALGTWFIGAWHLGTCCGGCAFATQCRFGYLAHRTDSFGDWNLGFLGCGLAIGSLGWASGSIDPEAAASWLVSLPIRSGGCFRDVWGWHGQLLSGRGG